jgi:5-methylcytosine-specific restriction endonuclease McrBC GTP-binding regulatory subunit McrB
MNYFTLADLKLLKDFSGKKYNNNDPIIRAGYDQLKIPYEKVEYWAKAVQQKAFPAGKIDVVKRPTNQGQKFEGYQWAKIFPNEDSFKKFNLAFTVGITIEGIYEIKIDNIRISEYPLFRSKYLSLRGDYSNSNLVKLIPYASISDWETLIDTTVEFIKTIEPVYNELFDYFNNDSSNFNNYGILASIGWNSSGWKGEPTESDLKNAKSFGWVNENNEMGESLNFAISPDAKPHSYHIGLSPNFNKNPTHKDSVKIVFMISTSPQSVRYLVGCYAFPEIGSFKRESFTNSVYEHGNIRAEVENILLLDNYLPASEIQLENEKNISKQSFTYLSKKNTFDIIFQLLAINEGNKELKVIAQKIIAGDNSVTSSKLTTTKKMSFNKILFGPPGTGKTYNTIDESLKIVSPMEYADIVNSELSKEEKRKKLKDLYNSYVDRGQIAFCTFHQSLNYEDFIEGIKPGVEEYGDGTKIVTYDIEDGIFKQLALRASYSYLKAFQPAVNEITTTELKFDLLWDAMLSELEKQLSENGNIELNTRLGKINVVDISDRGNIVFQHGLNGNRTYIVSYSRLKALQEGIRSKGELDAFTNINHAIRAVIGGCNATAYYAALDKLFSITVQTSASKEETTILPEKHPTYLEQKELIEKSGYTYFSNLSNTAVADKFVLIIDEINRGNVSQIFGELITLIEDDKRLSCDEALSVVLPYSKKRFAVPPNLYILGTMNTADKSIEALDTALRRRFIFQEMPPNPALLTVNVGQINLQQLLLKINYRIEVLLNKDHLIGHSFLINVDSIDKLKASFQNKIIPLLQEYFYGDYGKIGLVLGEGFVKLKPKEKLNNGFAKFESYDSSGFEDKEIYEIIDYTKPVDYELTIDAKTVKMDFIKAVELLLK